MRLMTGEQVLASFDEEDQNYIKVTNPLVVKMTPVIEDGSMVERITAQPLCQFSAEKTYLLPKSGIMFVKELHRSMIPHYLRIVKTYTEEVTIRDPEGELTVDDIRRKVDELEQFFNSGSGHTEEEEDDFAYLIEGNDTVH